LKVDKKNLKFKIMIYFIIGAAVALLLLGAGYVIGISNNPPRVSFSPTEATADCNLLCRQFKEQRDNRAIAELIASSAQSRLDSLNSKRNGFLAAAAIATAAAAAATLIPVIGLVAAAVSLGIAAAATVGAGLTQGEIIDAENDLNAKNADVITATQREQQAKRDLEIKCLMESKNCLQ
jgi:hypothetical protein